MSPAGRGIVLIIIAFAMFAVVDTTAKYLSQNYPILSVVWARYAFNMLAIIIVVGPRMGLDLVRTKHLKLQAIRGAVLTGSSILFFSALMHMPLAAASSITFIAPILVTAAAAIFLHERVRPATWVVLAACLVGVLMIVRPGSAVFTWWSILPVITAGMFSSYQLMTRRLAGHDSVYTTLFYPALIGTIVLTPIMLTTGHMPTSIADALLFVSVGVVGGVGHFILIKAYDLAPASTLAPFAYTQIASVLVLGYFVFGEFPDGWAFAGIAVIVISGLILVWRQRRPAPPLRR